MEKEFENLEPIETYYPHLHGYYVKPTNNIVPGRLYMAYRHGDKTNVRITRVTDLSPLGTFVIERPLEPVGLAVPFYRTPIQHFRVWRKPYQKESGFLECYTLEEADLLKAEKVVENTNALIDSKVKITPDMLEDLRPNFLNPISEEEAIKEAIKESGKAATCNASAGKLSSITLINEGKAHTFSADALTEGSPENESFKRLVQIMNNRRKAKELLKSYKANFKKKDRSYAGLAHFILNELK